MKQTLCKLTKIRQDTFAGSGLEGCNVGRGGKATCLSVFLRPISTSFYKFGPVAKSQFLAGIYWKSRKCIEDPLKVLVILKQCQNHPGAPSNYEPLSPKRSGPCAGGGTRLSRSL